ncbi:hypothetical protein MLD38_040190 [Melastoma candidum]|uniref:Uncharacterized protein n=1 Tax=Melastoma candidum TaxID=119954 RepID=A0ACB9L5E7_9MYRT|nr:hypothetical protein MLD38_040190 [Melastoma candidum]
MDKEEVAVKVGEVISSVKEAENVDTVIVSLHSLAVRLFPVDSIALSGVVDEAYRDRVLNVEVPSSNLRDEWRRVFYEGAAFPALARVILTDVASRWLSFFPSEAWKNAYDIFFLDGNGIEVVQTLIPFLHGNHGPSIDSKAVTLNIDRLLKLSLLERNGVLHIAEEFHSGLGTNSANEKIISVMSKVAQLIASIPDKARARASSSLSSNIFFKKIIVQLLSGLEKGGPGDQLQEEGAIIGSKMDAAVCFTGMLFARICRRGATDILLSEVVPRVLSQVRGVMSSSTSCFLASALISNDQNIPWPRLLEAFKDSYAIERTLEGLLHELVSIHAKDTEAYWVLWILFHNLFTENNSVRSLFLEKFLLWKVFPISCMRWIFHFAVFQSPPGSDLHLTCDNKQCLRSTFERLLSVWCKREFVQSAPLEQQCYVTAAVGLLLESMTKQELDKSKDAMHSILLGVSCRLESPDHLIRKMASSIALAFSKVVDPKNPLYLDDSSISENIDWEFGLAGAKKSPTTVQAKELSSPADHSMIKVENEEQQKPKTSDPLLAPLGNEIVSGEGDDNLSVTSDTSADSSLQPFDLNDDDSDLKRKFTQLVDVIGALRKSDDVVGVEQALDVAEKLVRTSPDELRYLASDLTRTLIQVRCSDIAVEGEEDSAEEKRQKALVALLVSCPLESLGGAHQLLYSPNVDISQRIMILDVMTEAAEELAQAKITKAKHHRQPLISSVSNIQPPFLSADGVVDGPWKEVSGNGAALNLLNVGNADNWNWSTHYERELPPRRGQIRRSGKTRRWSLKSTIFGKNMTETSQNRFPAYAAAFMLPVMREFDKKRHGVDLLGRDFVVLGKLIHMLGVCMKCCALHPEASVLAPHLLDLLRSREVCNHSEAYVRRAVLFAASCVLVALRPTFVATALIEGNEDISNGLEWIRTWAVRVVDSDTDRDCYAMASSCLQLHSEMALQASRALESAEAPGHSKSIGLKSDILPGGVIKIPRPNLDF